VMEASKAENEVRFFNLRYSFVYIILPYVNGLPPFNLKIGYSFPLCACYVFNFWTIRRLACSSEIGNCFSLESLTSWLHKWIQNWIVDTYMDVCILGRIKICE
jgi:hypothetical protein